MGLHIEVDGVWDLEARARIEGTIRDCVGEPPRDEEWTVSVSIFDSYSVVLVKTPHQTRRKMFFSEVSKLSEAIPEWLQQYPLR
jgi:hypothetical protein